MTSKPLSPSDTKRKLDQFSKNQKHLQLYKLSELSDSELRRMRAEKYTWVVSGQEDDRWKG